MVQSEIGLGAPPSGGAGRGPLAVLALLLIFHLGLYAGFFGGFEYDLDTQHYARISWELASGEFVVANHPFSQRFAITGPTALAYLLLGVNTVTTTLWPLVASLVSIVAVYFVARRITGPWAGALAAFLLALNIVQARHSSRLLPDIVGAMFMVIAAWLIQAARDSDSVARQRWYGIIAGVSSSVGLMAKETVLWAGCFFLVLLIKDLLHKRNAPLWRSLVVTCFLCGAAFFGAYAIATGDAMYRLVGIETTHNARDHSFFGKSSVEYVRRLTLSPLRFMLLTPGYGVPLLLSLPCLASLVRPIRALPRATRFWAAYFLTLLLFFWFGTTSLTSYNPLPVVERFLIPFLVPLVILSVITLRYLVFADPAAQGRRPGLIVLAAGFFAGAALIVGPDRSPKYAAFYAVFGLAALVLALRPGVLAAQGARVAGWVLLCALYLVPTVTYAMGAERAPGIMVIERDLLSQEVATLRGPTLILTDRHSAFFLPLIVDPKTHEHVRFVDWRDAKAHRADPSRRLVYIHQPRLLATNLNWGFPIPWFTDPPPQAWKLVASRSLDQQSWIWLLEVEDVDAFSSM